MILPERRTKVGNFAHTRATAGQQNAPFVWQPQVRAVEDGQDGFAPGGRIQVIENLS